MSSPVDLVLSRLDDPRQNGRDRWRAACPVCGERNRSTLSIGIGNNDAVMLTCFKSGCSVDAIAGALGIKVEDLFPSRDASAGPPRRRRMISAAQALEMLNKEANVVWVIASDIARGKAITDQDRERALTAAGRIGELREETQA